jgi:Rel/ankyrin family protein
MGIIRNPRPKIKAELRRKKIIELEFETNRKPTVEEMSRIEKESEEEAKAMNLNQVCLKFDAIRYNEQFQKWERICEPIYSNVVNDTKSAKTGQLKICRMSTTASVCSGGDEIFLFVEKVCKDNIKVRFFEGEEDDRIWVADGIFDETDVHHQFGIVLKTPKYKDESIQEPINVWIELYRPSDGCVSNPLPFKYKPNAQPGSKRKRNRRDSTEIPTVVASHERSLTEKNSNSSGSIGETGNNESLFGGQFFDNKSNINEDQLALEVIFAGIGDLSGEFFSDFDPSMIEDSDLSVLSQYGLAVDSVTNQDNISRVLDKIKLLERIFKNDYEEKKMKFLIWELIEKQTDGDNILFDAIESLDVSKAQELAFILLKYKFINILFDTTERGENCLHLSVKCNKIKLIKFFSRIGVDANKVDSDGNTPLHLAVIENNFEVVEELIKSQVGKVKQSILKFDLLNDHGDTAMHIAARLD